MITIELVNKAAVNDPNQYFDAAVEDVGTDRSSCLRWIKIVEPCAGDYVTRVLYLQHYYMSVVTYPCKTTSANIQRAFDKDVDSQQRAFALLETSCSEDKKKEALTGDNVSGVRGPMRVEVSLREDFKVGTPIKMVVMTTASPKGHFASHSVTGRVWSAGKKSLGEGVETYWSESHSIVSVEFFFSNVATSSTPFGASAAEKEKAWKLLGAELKRITPETLKILMRWNPGPPGGITTGAATQTGVRQYGSPTYPRDNRTQWSDITQASTREGAYYRVAGDEVGATLYRKQEERYATEGDDVVEDCISVGELPDETAPEEKAACAICGALTCTPETCVVLPAYAGYFGSIN